MRLQVVENIARAIIFSFRICSQGTENGLIFQKNDDLSQLYALPLPLIPFGTLMRTMETFLFSFRSSVHKLTFRAKRWAPNPSKATPVIIKILLHRTEESLAQLTREYEMFVALQEK
jgi:hypothetical protein